MSGRGWEVWAKQGSVPVKVGRGELFMSRAIYLMAIGLALGSTGCCMCASPYDYCGPTFQGECGEPCMCHERYGSAISDGHCGFYCEAGGCDECGESVEGPGEFIEGPGEFIEGPTDAAPEEGPPEMYYEEGKMPTPATGSPSVRRATAKPGPRRR